MKISTTTKAAGGMADLLRKIRSKGFRGTSRSIAYRMLLWGEWIRGKYFEWKLGISTAGIIPSDALGHPHADYHEYDPAYYGSIHTIMRALDLRRGNDVFIDFGSGKGRVLIVAAMYPFQRMIGVEFSPELNDIAQQNIQRALKWTKCQNIEAIAVDAAVYEVHDDAAVLYFQNPFSGEILGKVLENIKASLMRTPRRISLISHSHHPTNPFEQQIRMCPWMQRGAEVRLQRGTRAWIYTNAQWSGARIGLRSPVSASPSVSDAL